MTRYTSKRTLKTVGGRDEEDITDIESNPIDKNTIGRPVWWFNGSLFIPKTFQDRKLALLQYQSLVKENAILSTRAQRIRKYIGVLSQWFPISILDEIGKEILLETNLQQNEENLLAHLLGALEVVLRQRNNTIRWATVFPKSQKLRQF